MKNVSKIQTAKIKPHLAVFLKIANQITIAKNNLEKELVVHMLNYLLMDLIQLKIFRLWNLIVIRVFQLPNPKILMFAFRKNSNKI